LIKLKLGQDRSSQWEMWQRWRHAVSSPLPTCINADSLSDKIWRGRE